MWLFCSCSLKFLNISFRFIRFNIFELLNCEMCKSHFMSSLADEVWISYSGPRTGSIVSTLALLEIYAFSNCIVVSLSDE